MAVGSYSDYARQIGLNLSDGSFGNLIASNLQSLRDSFFTNVLCAAGNQEEQLRYMAQLLKMEMPEKYFAVCVMSVHLGASNVGQTVLSILIRDTFVKNMEEMDIRSYFFNDGTGTMNFIINTYDPESKKKMDTAVAHTRQMLRGVGDFHLFFSVGPAVEHLNTLYASRTAAYTNLLRIRANISSAERMSEVGQQVKYTYSVQEQLMKFFRDNDAAGIIQIIHSHIHQLLQDDETGHMLTESFLMGYLKNLVKECQKRSISIEDFENYLPAVTCLLNSKLDGTVEYLTKLTEQIINHISTRGTNESHHLLRTAKDYVRDHLADETLNLERVSNHVGLSRVYFCKLFHQLEGISFNVYLKKMRIEKAKQLLMTTNLKIFEISSDVGFSHAKYFGQVFKQEVGQTPAQYQKMVQRK